MVARTARLAGAPLAALALAALAAACPPRPPGQGSCADACGEGAVCVAGQCRILDEDAGLPEEDGGDAGGPGFDAGFDVEDAGPQVDAGCRPGDVAACYTGPAGTEGTGLCEAGVARCREDGTFAPCQGEVLPSDEVSNNGVDEDCDGEDLCAPQDVIAGDGVDDDCDGQDEVCAPVAVPIAAFDDCFFVACPSDGGVAYPVGCDLVFGGSDARGCVVHAPGATTVGLKEGDGCDNVAVNGTLLCSPVPCATGPGVDGGPAPRVKLDAQTCPINKPTKLYPDAPSGCP